MPQHNIAVLLDAQNNVTVIPNSVPVKSSHTVRWLCLQGGLRIIFPGPESPLRSGLLVVSAPGGDTGVLPLRKPSKKRFKYTAEVSPLGGGVSSVDPDLVVEDGGGGGKKKTKAAKATVSKKKKAKK
jgi:hypothetical protein